MNIQLSQLLKLEFISLITPSYNHPPNHIIIKNIRFVHDLKQETAEAGDFIFLHSCPNITEQSWQATVATFSQKGVAALGFKQESFLPQMKEALIRFAKESGLPLIEMAKDTDIFQLINALHQNPEANQAPKITHIGQGLEKLRQGKESQGIKGLLSEIHQLLEAQCIVLINHDIYASPPISTYNNFYTNANNRQKLPALGSFQWIEHSYLAQHQSYVLRCKIVCESYTVGNITISRKLHDFTEDDCLFLDYSSVLLATMNHNFPKSSQVHKLLEMAYHNQSLTKQDLEPVPLKGYALVLREYDKEKPKKVIRHKFEESFLGYLIHNRFDYDVFFSFMANGDLLLFTDTPNINQFLQEFSALFEENNRQCIFGVSRLYPKEKMALAFAEAKHAAGIGQLLETPNNIFFFHDLGIYRLFSYPDNSWNIDQMINEMTEQLYTFEDEKRQVLTGTLTCLVKNNFNYSKTAEELYTHTNTIRYRVGLLEQLWNKDLSNDDDKLLFRLIGKLLPLWTRSTKYDTE